MSKRTPPPRLAQPRRAGWSADEMLRRWSDEGDDEIQAGAVELLALNRAEDEADRLRRVAAREEIVEERDYGRGTPLGTAHSSAVASALQARREAMRGLSFGQQVEAGRITDIDELRAHCDAVRKEER